MWYPGTFYKKYKYRHVHRSYQENHLVTNDALIQLWGIQSQLMVVEKNYWVRAGELIDQGLISVDDAAVIYGIHPSTARKRLKQAHELQAGQRMQETRISRGPS